MATLAEKPAPVLDHSMSFTDRPKKSQDDAFEIALKELKKLRPLLLDAADYSEASYINSDRKDVELNNVRDYAVSMLVTLVDRLGIVADKLNDNVVRTSHDMAATEVRVSSLTERVHACWEYSGRAALSLQQKTKAAARCPKRYVVSDNAGDDEAPSQQPPAMLRETFGMEPSQPPQPPLLSPSVATPPPVPPLLFKGSQLFKGLSVSLPSPSSSNAPSDGSTPAATRDSNLTPASIPSSSVAPSSLDLSPAVWGFSTTVSKASRNSRSQHSKHSSKSRRTLSTPSELMASSDALSPGAYSDQASVKSEGSPDEATDLTPQVSRRKKLLRALFGRRGKSSKKLSPVSPSSGHHLA